MARHRVRTVGVLATLLVITAACSSGSTSPTAAPEPVEDPTATDAVGDTADDTDDASSTTTGDPVDTTTAPAEPMPRDPIVLEVDIAGRVPAIAQVSAADGGSLEATSPDGTVFTLTIPPGALLDDTSIAMTPVASATGPDGLTVLHGVDLQPDGLALQQPAVLEITAESITPDTEVVTWDGAGVLELPIAYAEPGRATFSLIHFSGYGTAAGVDAVAVPTRIEMLRKAVADEARSAGGFTSMLDGRSDLIGKNLDAFFVRADDGDWDLIDRPSDGEDCLNMSAISAMASFHHLRLLLGADVMDELGALFEDLEGRLATDLDCLRKACEAGDTTAPLQYSRTSRFAVSAGVLREPLPRLPIEKCQPSAKVTFRADLEVMLPPLPGWKEVAAGEGYLGAADDAVSTGVFEMDVRVVGIDDLASASGSGMLAAIGAAVGVAVPEGAVGCSITEPGPGRMEAAFRFIDSITAEIELRPYISTYTLDCGNYPSTFEPTIFSLSPILPWVTARGTSILIPLSGPNKSVDWNWFNYTYNGLVEYSEGGVTGVLNLYVGVSAEPGDPSTAPGPDGMIPAISGL